MRDFRAWLKRQRIGVLMGGLSAERDISLKTGRAILASLKRQGFPAKGIDAKRNLPDALRHEGVNFAFLALHGPGGEDGVVQGLLEWMGIPYTGSGVLASALAMDRAASKRLFFSAGLRTSAWRELTNADPAYVLKQANGLGFPLVVKPVHQGSAIGISIVQGPGDLSVAAKKAFKLDAEILLEKFIKGTEITVGILGDKPLPIIEIVPASRTFYDFHAKYAAGGSRHIIPARISPVAAKASETLAVAAAGCLGTRGACRVDLIVDEKEEPYLLEVNTIPGMTETSLLPDAARAAGLDFDALVLSIAESAVGF